MKIVIFGAGAIGSLFGSFLSTNNDITLICRKSHANKIRKSGLRVTGISKSIVKVKAETSVNKINFSPDLLIIAVKSYDTELAIKQAKKIINQNTTILSLQNGLDNIEKISKHIPLKQLIAGVTTHGSFFTKPGVIKHTGKGSTILGEINGVKTKRIVSIVKNFNKSGIKTKTSCSIRDEIWVKAIINSSINPLTTFFQCKNGYLIENPILENLVERICIESTKIANAYGVKLSYQDMINITKNVIENTQDNYSSMLQSYKYRKKTEIDSINGKLSIIGKKCKINTFLNDLLIKAITSL